MSTYPKQEHDFNGARGGFWIDPEGVSYPVHGECEHGHTIRSLGLLGYDDAHAKGWVHVGHYSCDLTASWYAPATVAALRTLADIVRYHAGTSRFANFGVECYPAATCWGTWCGKEEGRESPHWRTEEDPEAGAKMARFVMSKAIQKSAAEKAQAAREPELELAA